MTHLEILAKDFENEVATTRKFLAIIPDDKFDWKPHPKSMSIKQLSNHIVELPTWIGLALDTSELDFAKGDYKPTDINNRQELQDHFEKNVTEARPYFVNPENEEKLKDMWTLRDGENVYSTDPKLDVLRMSLNQTVHHRAQLGVFLRLLDIPIPGSYGPSADESF